MPIRFPAQTAAVPEPSKPFSAPEGRGLIIYGDPHGRWDPLVAACGHAPPAGVVLLGDLELNCPLRQQIEPVFAAGIPVFWIPGNHDARTADTYDRLWGDHPDGTLHARCVAFGGIRVAGLGGVFKARVWYPDLNTPVHHSRADYLRQLPHTNRWRGGMPLRVRDAIFPEDLDAMTHLRANVLIAHEAPSCHRHGFLAVDQAAQACCARLVVHGHHHRSYADITARGLHVRGLAKAEVLRLRREDLP